MPWAKSGAEPLPRNSRRSSTKMPTGPDVWKNHSPFPRASEHPCDRRPADPQPAPPSRAPSTAASADVAKGSQSWRWYSLKTCCAKRRKRLRAWPPCGASARSFKGCDSGKRQCFASRWICASARRTRSASSRRPRAIMCDPCARDARIIGAFQCARYASRSRSSAASSRRAACAESPCCAKTASARESSATVSGMAEAISTCAPRCATTSAPPNGVSKTPRSAPQSLSAFRAATGCASGVSAASPERATSRKVCTGSPFFSAKKPAYFAAAGPRAASAVPPASGVRCFAASTAKFGHVENEPRRSSARSMPPKYT
mmetsp:Transcript_9335/g.30861  ORF Transcript_9335/g.30861 Transcript_9335/m.30861 type:complete len:316 (-) Transcript_9335:786-1733(-)